MQHSPVHVHYSTAPYDISARRSHTPTTTFDIPVSTSLTRQTGAPTTAQAQTGGAQPSGDSVTGGPIVPQHRPAQPSTSTSTSLHPPPPYSTLSSSLPASSPSTQPPARTTAADPQRTSLPPQAQPVDSRSPLDPAGSGAASMRTPEGAGHREAKDWSTVDLLLKRKECMEGANKMAVNGGLRIELALAQSATMPALFKASLPTHHHHLTSLPSLLPGVSSADCLQIFVAWANWTQRVQVATFPISGLLVAFFLADSVPLPSDRVRAVHILEQYRKATATVFITLGGMTIAQLVATERRTEEQPLLSAWGDKEWLWWRAMIVDASVPLTSWRSLRELAPSLVSVPLATSFFNAAHTALHSPSAHHTTSQPPRPAPQPSQVPRHPHSAQGRVTTGVSDPDQHFAPRPCSPPSQQSTLPQSHSTPQLAHNARSISRPASNADVPSVLAVPPRRHSFGTAVPQPVSDRSTVPASQAGPSHAVGAPSNATASADRVVRVRVRKPPPHQPVAPPFPDGQQQQIPTTLLQQYAVPQVQPPQQQQLLPAAWPYGTAPAAAAVPMSEKARGKQRAVEAPLPQLKPAHLAVPPAPVSRPALLQSQSPVAPSFAAMHHAQPAGTTTLTYANAAPPSMPTFAAPPRRSGRPRKSASRPVELPPEEQAAEDAFARAVLLFREAVSENIAARRFAAVRAAQPVAKKAQIDETRPYGDYVPTCAAPSLGAGLTSTVHFLRRIDPLNVLRPLPPPPLPPHQLAFTSSPLPVLEDPTRCFALNPRQFLAYPTSLHPLAPADSSRIPGLAFALGNDLATRLDRRLVQEPGKADEREKELKRLIVEKAKGAIAGVKMAGLPEVREPKAAKVARRLVAEYRRQAEQEAAKKRMEKEQDEAARAEVLRQREKEAAAAVAGQAEEVGEVEPAKASAPAPPLASSSSASASPPVETRLAASAPAAPRKSLPTPNSTAPVSATAARPPARPSLAAIGPAFSAPAVPGTRPRANSNGAGMRRRPSVSGADVHPLARFYASATDQVRTLARAKAAEIKGVPSDEVASGLAVATARMSPMTSIKGLRMPGSAGASPATGTSSLPSPDGVRVKTGPPASRAAISTPSSSQQPRIHSPPLVPLPGDGSKTPSPPQPTGEADVQMLDAEIIAEEKRAEPVVSSGPTALGVELVVHDDVPASSPSSATPPQTIATEKRPPSVTDAPSTVVSSISPTRAASAVSTPAASAAHATADTVSAAVKAFPSLAALSGNASASMADSSVTSPTSANPSPTSLRPQPIPSKPTTVPGARAPRSCAVCGSHNCPGRGGRQWCINLKDKGKGKERSDEERSPSPSSASSLAAAAAAPNGKGTERDRIDMPPPPLIPRKRIDSTRGEGAENCRWPLSLMGVPEAWLRESDPIMPFTMVSARRKRRKGM
ncbi:hypothetical protein JCM11641_007474 [Rhodosporidiobolus odoratus]